MTTTSTTSTTPTHTTPTPIVCSARLWNKLQKWLDSLAKNGDRHDMVMGGAGRCYKDCPACTAADLAKAMRNEAQNTQEKPLTP